MVIVLGNCEAFSSRLSGCASGLPFLRRRSKNLLYERKPDAPDDGEEKSLLEILTEAANLAEEKRLAQEAKMAQQDGEVAL